MNLIVSYVTLLIGTFPELYNMNNLTSLKISFNNFTSQIPMSIYTLSKLEFFGIQDNAFTGTISSNIGSLPRLSILYLGYNNFYGKLPDSMCSLTMLNLIDISDLLNVCYETCIAQYITSSFSAITSGSLNRCQNTDDIAICSILQTLNVHSALQNKYPRQFNTSTIIYESPDFPHGYPQGIDSYYSISTKNIIGYAITFDPLSQLGPSDRLCFYYTVLSTSLIGCYSGTLFPGMNGMSSLYIETPQFIVKFQSSYNPYESSSYRGFRFTAIPVDPTSNSWICTSPPSYYVMNDISNYLLENQLTLDQSYASNLCDNWIGITCTNGYVTSLDLSYSGIQGIIPSSIALLSHLKLVSFQYNSLIGSIPINISQMQYLQYIDLSNNAFTSTLPIQLGQLYSIQFLDASFNNLQGEIPLSLSTTNKTLKLLDLSNNQFTGVVNNSFLSLQNSTIINLSNNELLCYTNPWKSSITSRHLIISSNLPSCNQSNSSSSSSPFPTLVVVLVLVLIGLPLIIFTIYMIKSSRMRRKVYASFKASSNQVIHDAILEKKPIAIILKLINEKPNTISIKDNYGRTAFDNALLVGSSNEVIFELIHHTLPINPITKISVPKSIHCHNWITIVQHDKFAPVVSKILDLFPNIARELSFVHDDTMRTALALASPLCQLELRERTYFMRRYEILNLEHPEHETTTSMVYLAIDHENELADFLSKFLFILLTLKTS